MLITGVSGLLGNNLAHFFKHKYETVGLYNRHPVSIAGIHTESCDLTYPDRFRHLYAAFRPHVVIHCASLTDIDQCERDKQQTETVNVHATRQVAAVIRPQETKLIYISTDAVYDGKHGRFKETDPVSPLNYYGRSKYLGELALTELDNALVFRTNIYGWNVQNKLSLGEWIVKMLGSGEKTDGFTDARFSSIYTMELARVLEMAIRMDLQGTFNCASATSCSKYEFVLKIAECFGFDKSRINAISVDQFGFVAKRGKDLSLEVKKLEKALDYTLPSMDYGVERFYRDYRSGLPEEIKQGNHAGKKKTTMLSYGRQWISSSDVRAVTEVLRSDMLTQGPTVEAFEKKLAEYCGARYAVAVNSGTSALHIACLAAGISKKDEVITSPITFVASANCAVYCGATPVFADINPQTYNIDPNKIRQKLNARTRAILPVHFAGQSCDMQAIKELVSESETGIGDKIYIIEDASHALGSVYQGKMVGACEFSDMAAMSFHPVKHITCGEGGAVLTNDAALYHRLKRFRSHGITNRAEDFENTDRAFHLTETGTERAVNPWYYEQLDLGYNYRITDIHCALGLSQLKRIDRFMKRRKEIVDYYNRSFGGIEALSIPHEAENCRTNYHLYVLLIDFAGIGTDRGRFMEQLHAVGIGTQVHYIPVYTQPFFKNRYATGRIDCPNAEAYYEKCLSIPLYPAMSDADMESVVWEISHRVAPV